MKILCFLLFSICFITIQAQTTVASWQQVRDEDRDGRPSRCDCDYHKKLLVLKKDSTFCYEEIRGRLDPKVQHSENGTWKMENDSVLVLTVTTTSPFLGGENEKVLNPYRKTFVIDRWGHLKTPYDEEPWEGRWQKQPRKKGRH